MKRRHCLGIVVAMSLFASPALAQRGAQTPASASCNPATLFSGLLFTNLIQRIKSCAADDLKEALDDATAENDALAISCLAPAYKLVTNAKQGGLFLAFQTFRSVKRSGLVAACQAWVNNTITGL